MTTACQKNLLKLIAKKNYENGLHSRNKYKQWIKWIVFAELQLFLLFLHNALINLLIEKQQKNYPFADRWTE